METDTSEAALDACSMHAAEGDRPHPGCPQCRGELTPDERIEFDGEVGTEPDATATDPWRYVTPCCESTAWRWRATRGTYYCQSCLSPTDYLYDKKRETRVSRPGDNR